MNDSSIDENLVGKESFEIRVHLSRHILMYSNKNLATLVSLEIRIFAPINVIKVLAGKVRRLASSENRKKAPGILF